MIKNIKEIAQEVLSSVSSLESAYNEIESSGNPPCSKCGGYGWLFSFDKEGYEQVDFCVCYKQRKIENNLRKSGLDKQINQYNIYTFNTENLWQQKILSEAYRFIDDNKRQWLYIGGQVGSGKTHICTAISYEFIKMGLNTKYMIWRESISKLKHLLINDNEKYYEYIQELKMADVLFIDDLFKSERNIKPTTWEINILFEIIDRRYRDPDFITLFSSELSINELLEIDEAIGSRILEKTKSYYIFVSIDQNKNIRLSNLGSD